MARRPPTIVPFWIALAICPHRTRAAFIRELRLKLLWLAILVAFTAILMLFHLAFSLFAAVALGGLVGLLYDLLALAWLGRHPGTWDFLLTAPSTRPEAWATWFNTSLWAPWLVGALAVAIPIVVVVAWLLTH